MKRLSLAFAGLLSLSLGTLAMAATRQGDNLFDALAEPPAIDFRPGAAPSPAAPAPPNELSGNPLWSIPLTALIATRDRPIFSPSRRPVVVAAPSAPMPVAPPPVEAPVMVVPEKPLTLSLIGTISGTDDGIAIVQDPATRDVLRLRMGDVHSGWTLSAVRSREVTFNKGDRQEVLAIVPPEPNAAGMPPPGFMTTPTGEIYN